VTCWWRLLRRRRSARGPPRRGRESSTSPGCHHGRGVGPTPLARMENSHGALQRVRFCGCLSPRSASSTQLLQLEAPHQRIFQLAGDRGRQGVGPLGVQGVVPRPFLHLLPELLEGSGSASLPGSRSEPHSACEHALAAAEGLAELDPVVGLALGRIWAELELGSPGAQEETRSHCAWRLDAIAPGPASGRHCRSPARLSRDPGPSRSRGGRRRQRGRFGSADVLGWIVRRGQAADDDPRWRPPAAGDVLRHKGPHSRHGLRCNSVTAPHPPEHEDGSHQVCAL
jgi:hypothetical protein